MLELGGKVLEAAFAEVIKQELGSIKRGIKKSILSNDLAHDIAARKYYEEVLQQFSMIKIFGMNKSQELADIYISTSFNAEKLAREQEVFDPEYLIDSIQHPANRSVVDGKTLIEDNSKIVVLGKPGAGKSVFLKSLILGAVNTKTDVALIPIFISLKDCSDKKCTVMEQVYNAFEICNFKHPEIFVESALLSGRCILLLDGLDEIKSDLMSDYVRDIEEFSRKHAKNKFVITCRDAVYDYWFESFVDVEILPFGIEQVEEFVTNWFKDKPNVAEMCYAEINNRPEALQFATNPLLLTLMCITFNDAMALHSNKGELYRDALDIYLRRWDSHRLIVRGTQFPTVTNKHKELLFSQIAFNGLELNNIVWRESDLLVEIEALIENWEGFYKQPNSQSFELLRELEARHSILVQKSKRRWGFYHLTFQEYYSAKFLVDNAHNINITDFVISRLNDSKWKEIIVLVCALLSDPSTMIDVIQKNIKLAIDELWVKQRVASVLRRLTTKHTFTPIVTRSQAVHYIVHQLISPAREIDESISRLSGTNKSVYQKALIKLVEDCEITKYDPWVFEQRQNEFKDKSLAISPAWASIFEKEFTSTIDKEGLNDVKYIDKQIIQGHDIHNENSDEDRFQVKDLGAVLLKLFRKLMFLVDCLTSATCIGQSKKEEVLSYIESISERIVYETSLT